MPDMAQFKIPGAPLSGDTKFCDMHVWQWAEQQPRKALHLTLTGYLSSIGFVAGRDAITEHEYDTLSAALDIYQRTAPHLKGTHALYDLIRPAGSNEGGYMVIGAERGTRYVVVPGVLTALRNAGWVYSINPTTTYFEVSNGVLWAKYQDILGSRPLARVTV